MPIREIFHKESHEINADCSSKFCQKTGEISGKIPESIREFVAVGSEEDAHPDAQHVGREAPVTGGSGPSDAAANDQVEQFGNRYLVNQGSVNENCSSGHIL